MAEIAAVDETFKRLQSHKGVIGVCVVNADGIAIRSTFDNETSVAYAAMVSQLTVKARRAVKQLDAGGAVVGAPDDLRFIRIRSRKHEIMIAPEREYCLVVVQDPSAE